MRYASIEDFDTANGKWCGVCLYVQGCPLHCSGCFNPETWDFDGGKEFTDAELFKIRDLLSAPHIKRLSLLGGEPLMPQNYEDLSAVVNVALGIDHSISIWLWTGRTFEDVYKEACETKDRHLANILDNVDYMIDGPFVQEERDITLPFCGSRNQRVLDLGASTVMGRPVLSKYDWRKQQVEQQPDTV